MKPNTCPGCGRPGKAKKQSSVFGRLRFYACNTLNCDVRTFWPRENRKP
jgi:hypothetical protein